MSDSIKILALDPATKCGWAHSLGPSGVWDCSIRPDESDGMRVLRLAGKIRDVHRMLGIDLIAYERATSVPGRARATITHSELQGAIKLLAEELSYTYRGYSAGEIKKHATGKGNCGKAAMVEAAKKRGWEVEDDNHADALFLLDLAQSDLGVDKSNPRVELEFARS